MSGDLFAPSRPTRSVWAALGASAVLHVLTLSLLVLAFQARTPLPHFALDGGLESRHGRRLMEVSWLLSVRYHEFLRNPAETHSFCQLSALRDAIPAETPDMLALRARPVRLAQRTRPGRPVELAWLPAISKYTPFLNTPLTVVMLLLPFCSLQDGPAGPAGRMLLQVATIDNCVSLSASGVVTFTCPVEITPATGTTSFAASIAPLTVKSGIQKGAVGIDAPPVVNVVPSAPDADATTNTPLGFIVIDSGLVSPNGPTVPNLYIDTQNPTTNAILIAEGTTPVAGPIGEIKIL